MSTTEIWHYKKEYLIPSSIGIYRPSNRQELDQSHKLVRTINETDPDRVFSLMQSWYGDNQDTHSSTSIGDIIIIQGIAYYVNFIGFIKIW